MTDLQLAAESLAAELRPKLQAETMRNIKAAEALEALAAQQLAIKAESGGHAAWHRHTDQIVDRYSPEVRDAMAQVFEAQAVRHAIRAAYTSSKVQAAKATRAPSQQTVASSRAPAATTAAATVTGTALVPAALAGAGAATAAGSALYGAALTVALSALAGATLGTAALGAVLTKLYQDAYLQGNREASQALGGKFPDVGLGSDYWETWRPGHHDAAALLRDSGGLQRLLNESGARIRGITETLLDRIGKAIAEGIEQGLSPKETAKRVDAIIHDTKRAQLIADTEYVRAHTAAAMSRYRAEGVAYLKWIAMPGACEQCMVNATTGPDHNGVIAITDSWPMGPPPVHPHERCTVAPWFPQHPS